MGALTPTRGPDGDQDSKGGYFSPPTSPGWSGSFAASTMSQATPSGKVPLLSKVDAYEQKMGTGTISASPTTDMASTTDGANDREEEREEREMFLRLEKPRVRYDVEVVTKLIVYSGMQHFPPPNSFVCL
jgi:hypothetical protein